MSNWRPDSWTVAVDIVLLTLRSTELQVLLVRSEDPAFNGAWALPGGRVSAGETLRDAAARELREETGVDAPWLEQLATYGDPDRDPRGRVLSVAYVAIAPDLPLPQAGSDVSHTRWCPVSEVPALAFDHDQILTAGLERARAKLEHTTVATSFLAGLFTLGDVHAVYVTVWGIPLHLANFRRKVLAVPHWLTPTDEVRAPGPEGGPASRLYRAGPQTAIRPALDRDAMTRGADGKRRT